MKLLNLGCGQRFHDDWINVDFISGNKNVMAHDLLSGIPFNSNDFDVVYHSHVLEHFTKEDGRKFTAECFRVLKPGGIIRVAVPDLEQIVRNYLKSFEGALAGDTDSVHNYEWMMLEMYDQAVRNNSGGKMAEYFYQSEIPNEKFVFSRVGEEGRQIRKKFLNQENKKEAYVYKPAPLFERVFNPKTYILKIKNILFKKEITDQKENQKFIDIGKFRLGGEIHYWMYDRYSLGKLLSETGFVNFSVKSAFDSDIDKWSEYKLEATESIVYKPDSLFVEARKSL